MPGLAGYVSQAPVDAGLIEAMIQPMKHRPTYRVQHHGQGLCAIGTIDLSAGRQASSAQSPDGRSLLVVFGALYESWAPRERGVAQVLLTRWQQEGTRGLMDLNGEYLIALWRHDQQSLTLINDRLGLKRLHLWKDETSFAFASELKSLAVLPQVRRAVHEEALAELLTFGHLQDDHTLLRDVKLLPPASVLTWQRGRLSLERYWQYVFQADPALEDLGQATQAFAERLKTAVSRRLEGHERVGLLLSGGLDSRTVAGMLRKLRFQGDLFTYTAGHPHAHDVRFAQQIAAAIRSRHISLDIPATFLGDFGPEYAWVLDGMVSTHGSHRSCLSPWLAADSLDVVMIGFLGDVLSGDKHERLESYQGAQTPEDLVSRGYHYYATACDEALLGKLLRPTVHRRVRGLARETFLRTVQQACVEHPFDRMTWAELIQRQRFWNPLAQLDLGSLDYPVATPFTDTDFIDFALRLPFSQRANRVAYRQMICREFPDLARIGRAGDGLPLIYSRIRAVLHWRWLFFERHVLPLWTKGRWGGHPYGTFVHCKESFCSANRTFIEKTLMGNPILEEYFQPEALSRLVREFLDGTVKQDRMEVIAALISFSLFQKQLDSLAVYPTRLQARCAAS